MFETYDFSSMKEGDEGHRGLVLLLGHVLSPLLHQPQGRGHLRGRLYGYKRHFKGSKRQLFHFNFSNRIQSSGLARKHSLHLLLRFLIRR